MHAKAEPLSRRAFERISELAYKACGVDLKSGKRELVEARLRRKIGRETSFEDYYQRVLADRSGVELAGLLDVLTTNVTAFFREPAHFEFLRKTILPGLAGPARIWCAGSATGEEAFSVAFSLLEELGMETGVQARILATDISTRALAAAARATYPAERFAGAPGFWLRKYLLRGAGPWEGWYRVKPEVRRMIEFRRRNLMDAFEPSWRFHVIFCRNVMIYFDKVTREKLVNRMAACLEPGGYLLTGHSESLAGLAHPFQYVRPAVYRRPR